MENLYSPGGAGSDLGRLEAYAIEQLQDALFDASLPHLGRILETSALHVPEELGVRTEALGQAITTLVAWIEEACAEIPDSFFALEIRRRMHSKPFAVFSAHLDASMRRCPNAPAAGDAVEALRYVSEQLVQLAADICLAKFAAYEGSDADA